MPSEKPFPFESAAALLSATELEIEGNAQPVIRLLEGAIKVGKTGVYLMADLLGVDIFCDPFANDPETTSYPRYPGGVTLLLPGTYHVESLAPSDWKPGATRFYTVLFSVDWPVSVWKHHPHSPGMEHECLTILTPEALARWIEKQETDDERRSHLKSKSFASDVSFQDETADLMAGVPDEAFWKAQGFRFNQAENGEGVFVHGPDGIALWWGYAANGGLAGLVCKWP